jgi:hypothetical protein
MLGIPKFYGFRCAFPNKVLLNPKKYLSFGATSQGIVKKN